MSKTPFMPLWVSDFLGDTLDLDASEIGAYMLLLMAQWNRSGESLPNDDAKLKRVARAGRNWPKIWDAIGRYFTEDENGIYSKRLRLEAQSVASKREVNAQNGARGGKAKALKNKEAPLANAKNSPQRNPSIPEPEPYKEDRDTKVSLVLFAPESDQTEAAISKYNEAAKATGWPIVQRISPARKAALKARLKDCGGIDGWTDAIQKAVDSDFLCGRTDKSWMGFGFDWLTKSANFTKLMEGNYANRTGNNGGAAGGTANQGTRRAGIGSGTTDAFAAVAERLSRM